MADDTETEHPGNVISLPPPGVPGTDAPAAEEPPADRPPDSVRTSPFEAPPVPVPPPEVPAAFRDSGPADTGPPRPRALTLAAILAIALAAAEGMQTWIKESAPRRAEDAKHKRELEHMTAKADTDAARLAAQTDNERAKAHHSKGVQPAHEYGRNTLGRGSGGPGHGDRGHGPAGHKKGGRGPHSASGGHGGDAHPPSTPGRPHRSTAGQHHPASRRGAGDPAHSTARNSTTNGSTPGRTTLPQATRKTAEDRWNNRSPSTPALTKNTDAKKKDPAQGSSTSGRTTLPQATGEAMRDRWNNRSPSTPVLTKNKPKDESKKDGPKDGKNTPDESPKDRTANPKDKSADPKPSDTGPKDDPDRTTFWDAVSETADKRWRERETLPPHHANDPADNPAETADPDQAKEDQTGDPPTGPKHSTDQLRADQLREHVEKSLGDDVSFWAPGGKPWKDTSSMNNDPGGASENTATTEQNPDTGPGPGTGPGTEGDEDPASEWDPIWDDMLRDAASGREPEDEEPQGFRWDFRTSPWDEPEPEPEPVTITVDRADGGPRRPGNSTRASTGSPRGLPRTGPPALPRAPQRPAGKRPGTTRRRDPFVMEPNTTPASAPAPAVAPRHATEITLDDALRLLGRLTTQGMETHDECAELARAARRLMSDLEAMTEDLADAHNVTSKQVLTDLHQLREAVGALAAEADRKATAALDAAELSEAEEIAMNRDYRPVADATADAGLTVPTSRLHNEN